MSGPNGVGKSSPSEFCDCLSVCSNLCVVVRYRAEVGFRQHFVPSSSRETLLQSFESLSVQV